jgi:hypothetical protein
MHRGETVVGPVSQMTSLKRPAGRGRSSKSLIAPVGDTARRTAARQIHTSCHQLKNQGKPWGVDDGMISCIFASLVPTASVMQAVGSYHDSLHWTGVEERDVAKIQLFRLTGNYDPFQERDQL